MPADPKTSDGARKERAAFREYLRRQKRACPEDGSVFQVVLDWVLNRQARYDKRAGGLGRR